VSQVSQFTDTSGSGQFADAIAGYDGLRSYPPRADPVQYESGDSYEVWMWCWHVGQNMNGTAFIAPLECPITAVLFNAGPPLVIH
jgi:hypothetical protein